MRLTRRRASFFGSIVVAGTWLASCSSGEVGGASSGPSTATDAGDASVPSFVDGSLLDPLESDAALATRVAVLFATTCSGLTGETSCHASGAGGLHLRLVTDGGDVVGVPSVEEPSLLRVQPGDPDRSYLYRKLLEDAGVDGGRMPKDVPAFDARLPALVGAWIDAGAPLPP